MRADRLDGACPPVAGFCAACMLARRSRDLYAGLGRTGRNRHGCNHAGAGVQCSKNGGASQLQPPGKCCKAPEYRDLCAGAQDWAAVGSQQALPSTAKVLELGPSAHRPASLPAVCPVAPGHRRVAGCSKSFVPAIRQELVMIALFQGLGLLLQDNALHRLSFDEQVAHWRERATNSSTRSSICSRWPRNSG